MQSSSVPNLLDLQVPRANCKSQCCASYLSLRFIRAVDCSVLYVGFRESALFSSFAQAHTDFDVHHDGVLADADQIFVKANSPWLEGDNDRRATELEDAELVPFVDMVARLLPLIVDPMHCVKPRRIRRTDQVFLPDGSNLGCSNRYEQNISELFRLDHDVVSRIARQNVDFAPNGNGIDLVIVPRHAPELLDGPGDGAVIPMVVLRREAKARHGTVGVLWPELFVHDKSGD